MVLVASGLFNWFFVTLFCVYITSHMQVIGQEMCPFYSFNVFLLVTLLIALLMNLFINSIGSWPGDWPVVQGQTPRAVLCVLESLMGAMRSLEPNMWMNTVLSRWLVLDQFCEKHVLRCWSAAQIHSCQYLWGLLKSGSELLLKRCSFGAEGSLSKCVMVTWLGTTKFHTSVTFLLPLSF